MSEPLPTLIVELRKDDVERIVRERIGKGDDANKILEECRRGMEIVGRKYEEGEHFLAELMLAGEIFKSIASIVEPYVARAKTPGTLGKAVLATLKGDIHDLGKNIFAIMLKAQGFETYDMGVDVDPADVVEKVKTVRPDFVCFSALMTTVFDNMKQAAQQLGRTGLRSELSLMIGGGATNATVREYVGADFQSLDAMEGVGYCTKKARGRRVA